MRLGIEQVLDATPDITLVGSADNEIVAQALLVRTKPHVILVHMQAGFDLSVLMRLVRRTVADAKIVLLCTLEGIPIPIEVDAVVLTVQPTVVLVATICHIVGSHSRVGEVGPGKDEARDLTQRQIAVRSEPTWPNTVTARERDVIELIAQGLSNKAIADRLCISSITVRHHLTTIFDKLGVKSRQTLLIHAHRSGLVALERFDTDQKHSRAF